MRGEPIVTPVRGEVSGVAVVTAEERLRRVLVVMMVVMVVMMLAVLVPHRSGRTDPPSGVGAGCRSRDARHDDHRGKCRLETSHVHSFHTV